MLLLNTLSAFAQTGQTTDIIPTGGEWQSVYRVEPFDTINAACELDFSFLWKNEKFFGCMAARLSSKQTYTPYSVFGYGTCFIELQKLNLSDGLNGTICTGFFEPATVMSAVIHYPTACPAPTASNRQARANNPACTCPVEPLKPITDPIAISFENGESVIEDKLTPGMKKSLACLKNAGVGFTVTSAWRPKAYQDHLYEIYTKLLELDKEKNKNNPACKPIHDAIEKDRAKHGIANLLKNKKGRKRVAETSKHSIGLAFDGSWKVSDAKLDKTANSCGVYRRIKEIDRPHFEPL